MPTNKPSIARYRVTLALPIPGWRRRGWTPRRRHFVKHNGAKLCLTPPNLLSSPSFSSSASTTEAGRRTARLLPHFATRIGSSTDKYLALYIHKTGNQRIAPAGGVSVSIGKKRPADVIGNAVTVMRIATGEEEEGLPELPRGPRGIERLTVI